MQHLFMVEGLENILKKVKKRKNIFNLLLSHNLSLIWSS